MLRIALVVMVVCVVPVGTGVRAAELEGFGPIKFGMTKEEAWAAIDGKGEWLGNSSLVYDHPVDRGTIPLKVYQGFTDGRAVEVTVVHDRAVAPRHCRETAMVLTGLIRGKYNKIPLAHYGEMEGTPPGSNKSYDTYDVLMFNFPRGAYIKITTSASKVTKREACMIMMLYRPPTDDKIPF